MGTKLITRFKAQEGFTLTELLAVMAILGILAGLVAGAVSRVGGEAQAKRLLADETTIGKSADAYFNEAFPQSYPVVALDATPDFLEPDTDLGVRLPGLRLASPAGPHSGLRP